MFWFWLLLFVLRKQCFNGGQGHKHRDWNIIIIRMWLRLKLATAFEISFYRIGTYILSVDFRSRMVYLQTKPKFIWKVGCAIPPIFCFRWVGVLLFTRCSRWWFDFDQDTNNENLTTHTPHIKNLSAFDFKCQIASGNIEKQSWQFWRDLQKITLHITTFFRAERSTDSVREFRKWSMY